MVLRELEISEWRNFASEKLEFHPGVNLFSGANAQGKTNLLEAVELLSSGRPFRAIRDREAVRFDAPAACVSGVIEGERTQTLSVTVPQSGKKTVRIDGAPAALSELWGRMPTVLFCPEDLEIIKSGPAERRALIDSTLCQLRPRYGALLTAYRRALAQKSALLRKEDRPADTDGLLDVFDRQMIAAGAEIIRFRGAFVRLLLRFAPRLHAEISGGETLDVQYRTVSFVTDPEGETVRDELVEHMRAHRAAELAARACLSGPHRDDLAITVDGREARTFGSQGQCRTAAIALKLACRELMEKELAETPLLLLDDILSELDGKRQDFVLNGIDRGQIFITGCETSPAERLRAGRIFGVSAGSVASVRDF
jgi:DNA replication and repair protein RecF